MRRLVNNWLFGQVSAITSGRLDSDVYGNSCSELKNMYVHKQGGISRRPPLRKLAEVEGYSRIIPFTIDATNSFLVLLGEGKFGVYDWFNDDFEETTEIPTPWDELEESEIKEIRYASYYNDLYMVHPNYPLLRMSYIGSSFTLQTPHIYVNQDIKMHNTILGIDLNVVVSETLYIKCGDIESSTFSVSNGDTKTEIINKIASVTLEGFTLEAIENQRVRISPNDMQDKFIDYSSSMKILRSSDDEEVQSFDYLFTTEDYERESVSVFGTDDFLPCYLNQEDPYGITHYASDIMIARERMWLAVNGNPCMVYASRPYGTSQIIYPKDSNDTILDFIEFELVTTEVESMKDQSLLSVSKTYDSDGDLIYSGTVYEQKLWIPPTSDEGWTKGDLDSYRAQNELICVQQEAVVQTIKDKSNNTLYVLVDGYFETYDEEPYDTKTYYYESNATFIPIVPDAQGTHGIMFSYYHTKDVYINSQTQYYYQDSTTLEFYPVTKPDPALVSTYYERGYVFKTPRSNYHIYEQGKYYEDANHNPVRVEYQSNSRINKLYKIVDNEMETLVSAEPYYQFDISDDSVFYNTEIKINEVATASTGMKFQLASGRNDKIKWMVLHDNIMIGTESTEWRIPHNVTALDGDARVYSSFGSNLAKTTLLNTDMIVLQKGNYLRLYYVDNYGLQNIDLTTVNPEILDGEIGDMVSYITPEPNVAVLKDDEIVNLCIDRTNGVQAFSEWTFFDTPISISVVETEEKQFLIALMDSQSGQYLAYFDTNEEDKFLDCAYDYKLSEDTTTVSGKTYYVYSNDGYVVATNVTNPKSQGLYEFGLYNNSALYISRMTANPFDSIMQDGSVTLGDFKNVSRIIFRCLNTGRIVTYYNEKDKTLSRTPICCTKSGQYQKGLADHAVNVNGGTTRDLMITVESWNDEPMTLLAMAYDLRINRNGN